MSTLLGACLTAWQASLRHRVTKFTGAGGCTRSPECSASCATGQARLASGRARRKVRRLERLLHSCGQWRAMSQRDSQPARLGERVAHGEKSSRLLKTRYASCRPVRYLRAPEHLRVCHCPVLSCSRSQGAGADAGHPDAKSRQRTAVWLKLAVHRPRSSTQEDELQLPQNRWTASKTP